MQPYNRNVILHSGFSLLEVLIAMIILSIGLLGIAGLQVTSKRTNFDAIQQTTATMLTRDIIERMRANPGQLAAYTNAGAGYTLTPSTGTTITAIDCSSPNTCTPAQLAQYDLYHWEQAILGTAETSGAANTGGLVSPTGCITAGASAGEISVAVAWRGLTKLSDPITNTCGNATNFYHDQGTADNSFRRVLFVNTYID